MKKCIKCGTEFEGNCCPHCGTWASDEKVCPKCGAKLTPAANFCNNCGFAFGEDPKRNKPKSSFGEKIARIGKWMKKHLFIVIPAAVAVLLVIILACTIPACIKGKDNGTYYALEYTGELDKTTYYKIDSGKWTDEDGNSGTYKKDGDKIIFYVEFFGSTEEAARGTLKDGVLTVDEDVFISSNHKHKYGEWKVTQAATSFSCAVETKSCACGMSESRIIHTPDEKWSHDEKEHFKLCTVCNEKCVSEKHSGDFICTVCDYPFKPTEGLKFTLSSDEKSYTVTGMGNANSGIIKIPDTYNALPVHSIGSRAFEDCTKLTTVIIPDSMTSIGNSAFKGCSSLTSITIGKGDEYRISCVRGLQFAYNLLRSSKQTERLG